MYKNKFLLVILMAFLLPGTSLAAEALKVASWNIGWLGSHKYNQRSSEDYAELARYAKLLDADVIALQEVENAEYASKVFGDDYDYYFSSNDWVQRVGVAVRKNTGLVVKAQEYRALDVGKSRYGMDITLSKGKDQLRLLAVHLKSGCFEEKLDKRSIKRMKVRSKETRKKKVACISLSNQAWLLENWIDSRARENIPFIVLGDFNRRFAIDIAKEYTEEQGLWQTIDDEGQEDLWSPTLSRNSRCWGGYHKHYIDHIVMDPRARETYVEGSYNQLVFEQKYTESLSRSLSDHCPISVEFNWP